LNHTNGLFAVMNYIFVIYSENVTSAC